MPGFRVRSRKRRVPRWSPPIDRPGTGPPLPGRNRQVGYQGSRSATKDDSSQLISVLRITLPGLSAGDTGHQASLVEPSSPGDRWLRFPVMRPARSGEREMGFTWTRDDSGNLVLLESWPPPGRPPRHRRPSILQRSGGTVAVICASAVQAGRTAGHRARIPTASARAVTAQRRESRRPAL